MKIALITGGSGGIGKAAATALAKKNYKVIIHGHLEEKTLEALHEIKRVSGNPNVDFITGDLSTVAGMKKFASSVQDRTGIIDSLILSTGTIFPQRHETADGMEMMFATQYLARFATVQLLLPQLKNSKLARIVHVGAPVMKRAEIHFDDLALKKDFSMLKGMAQCMFANHLFVQEFARRHANENVLMNIMFVGVVKTGISRKMNFFIRTALNLFAASPEKACRNAVYLASSDEATFSGYFLPKPGRKEVKKIIPYDPGVSEKLWETSFGLIGLNS